MNSFLFAVNAVAPIVIMIALGYILKKLGLMPQQFTKQANKLCFRVFLPCMLFLNVYKIEDIGKIELHYIGYVTVAVLLLFGLSFILARVGTKKRERRGVLAQAAFRSNYALIGIPLAQSLFGDEGAAVATLLSAAVIPLFNILAVICLSVNREKRVNFKKILLDILKNPLIESIALGCLLLLLRPHLPFELSDADVIYKPLSYLSNMATPIALLVLGAQFEFTAVGDMKREIIFGTVTRCLFVPILGLGTALLLFRNSFDGAHFATFTAVFTTPLAVSSVAMAQEMEADSALAGQLVVWTTLFSVFSTFFASFFLKMIGVF